MATRTGRDGRLDLRVERRGGASVVARSRSTLPLQVLAPVCLDGQAAIVSMLNPTGGLVGGDRLDVTIAIGPDAHACLTTPSATKVYRTAGTIAEQSVRIDIGARALCEWIPDHTIPFPGSALRQTLHAELAHDARLFVVDAFAAGRVARGEMWRFNHLESAVSVRDDRGWLYRDRFVLRAGRCDGRFLAEDRPYFATAVVIADARISEFVRDATATGDETGATVASAPLVRRGAVVRILADSAPVLVAALDALWALARTRVFGVPALDLRKP